MATCGSVAGASNESVPFSSRKWCPSLTLTLRSTKMHATLRPLAPFVGRLTLASITKSRKQYVVSFAVSDGNACCEAMKSSEPCVEQNSCICDTRFVSGTTSKPVFNVLTEEHSPTTEPDVVSYSRQRPCPKSIKSASYR